MIESVQHGPSLADGCKEPPRKGETAAIQGKPAGAGAPSTGEMVMKAISCIVLIAATVTWGNSTALATDSNHELIPSQVEIQGDPNALGGPFAAGRGRERVELPPLV